MPGFSIEVNTFFFLFIIFTAMVLLMWISWLLTSKKPHRALSVYTKNPVRPVTDLPYQTLAKVEAFFEKTEGYENQMFHLFKAVYCRDTGRIFPDAISWLGRVKLNWGFLSKKYHGYYVSWGSLQEDQQREIKEAHLTLEGFQTKKSCPNPNPKDILPEYIYSKPGPLYVDLSTKVLVGWKSVPNSDLEVLIVQKPKGKSHEES